MNNCKLKDIASVYLYILPLISRWLLPYGIESLFLINVFELFPIYILDFCYLIFPIVAKKRNKNKFTSILNITLLFQFSFSIIGMILNEYSAFLTFLVCNQFYFIAMLFAINYKFTSNQLYILRTPIILVFFALTVQVILYSMGILKYSLALSNNSEYSGVLRISTTMGAATGTSLILYMLGGLSFYLYEDKKVKYLILTMMITSLLVTMSRAAIFALIIFVFVILLSELKHKSIFNLKGLKLISAIILIMTMINYFGLINPLIERMNSINNEDAFSGRNVLFQNNLGLINSYPIFGVGLGNVYPQYNLIHFNYKPMFASAPHNFYLLTLIEQGIIGFIFFILFTLKILLNLKYKQSLLSIVFLLCVIILYNAETLFVNSEYIFLFALILSISLSDYEKYTIYNQK